MRARYPSRDILSLLLILQCASRRLMQAARCSRAVRVQLQLQLMSGSRRAHVSCMLASCAPISCRDESREPSRAD